jgi:hypothetical protein
MSLSITRCYSGEQQVLSVHVQGAAFNVLWCYSGIVNTSEHFFATKVHIFSSTKGHSERRRTSQLLGERTPESSSAPCELPSLRTCLQSQARHHGYVHTRHAMAGPGVNLATTRDGGSYNKLQRPQNYLMTGTTPTPPPKALLPEALAPTYTSKRKREDGGLQRNQRTRLERESVETPKSRPGSTSKERSRGTECGMRTILPGLDDEGQSSDEGVSEALAYLRNVR